MSGMESILARHREAAETRAMMERVLERHVGITVDFTPDPPKVRVPTGLRMALVQLLTARDGANCYLCHEMLEPGRTIVEHIIPKSRGGTDDAHNLALACITCNVVKRDDYVSIMLSDRSPRYHLAQFDSG